MLGKQKEDALGHFIVPLAPRLDNQRRDREYPALDRDQPVAQPIKEKVR
jgi:hypothetical protein